MSDLENRDYVFLIISLKKRANYDLFTRSGTHVCCKEGSSSFLHSIATLRVKSAFSSSATDTDMILGTGFISVAVKDGCTSVEGLLGLF